MWKINFKERDDGLITLHQCTTFLDFDKIITFELATAIATDDLVYLPVEINFTVKNDPEKKKYWMEMSTLVNRKGTITYYNPTPGTSGLTQPYTILENDLYFFKVMFHTVLLSSANMVQLTIEFYIQKK